jgi:hypothetical protein
MKTLGVEAVARAHFTRLSYWFFGLGPSASVRWSTSDVRREETVYGSTGQYAGFRYSSSTQGKTDLALGALFEVGVEIGKARRWEWTWRMARTTRLSSITWLGVALGYAF